MGLPAAMLAVVMGSCAPSDLPTETPEPVLPELAKASELVADVMLHVRSSTLEENLRVMVERTFLQAGYRVTGEASGAQIELLVANGAGTLHQIGQRARGMTPVSFVTHKLEILVTVLADGRSVDELVASTEYNAVQRGGEEFTAFSQRSTDGTNKAIKRLCIEVVNAFTVSSSVRQAIGQAAPASAADSAPPEATSAGRASENHGRG